MTNSEPGEAPDPSLGPSTLGSVTVSRVAPATEGITRRLPADQRREQLLEVALRLFAVRGFAATTMDDIAAAAGVTKPLLYQHFDSKRALYLELVDSVARDMLVAIGEATSAADGPRQQVEAGMAAYFELVVEHQSAFKILFGSDVPDDPELSSALRRVEDTVAEAVDALIDAGLDSEHRRLLAYAVVGMATGASRHWLAGNNRIGPHALGPSFSGISEGDDSGSVDGSGDDEVVTTPDKDEAARLARRVSDLAWAGLRSVHRD
jgi:AcrR family transcriptional regulator